MNYVWKYKLDHLIFWLITVLFYASLKSHLITSVGVLYFLEDVAVRNILIAGVCYINIYILFERYFNKGRYLVYGLLLLGLFAIYAGLQHLQDDWLRAYVQSDSGRKNIFYNAYYNISICIFYAGFTLSLELSKKWYQQQLLLHRVQTEKLNTELQFLKAQINPHFLFNSINTIYFQIDRSNTEARESLQKFSELLRYQLYECNEDLIPVEKEISYLESYVDMQRLRKNSQHSILFKTDDSVKGFSIAPLLLIPFVENAFKHLSNHNNISNTVEVNMSRENGSFLFNVRNSVDENSPNRNEPGIGLKNVKRRLDLLYNDKYQLNINKSPSSFSVELQIQL
ncbi:MAG TPA: histidine kinase [Flavitalea sp.]|nr:histidine kinase [Flavitalea sp.]